jgi:hypothetical protein
MAGAGGDAHGLAEAAMGRISSKEKLRLEVDGGADIGKRLERHLEEAE